MTVSRRSMNIIHRISERIAYSKFGTWFILNVASRVDPWINKVTEGRISIASWIGLPLALLTTIGAKSGLERNVALLFFEVGDDVILIASNGGKAKNPAWYHNLRANPQAQIYIRGKTRTYRAREAEGQEREDLWAEAVRVYAGYDVYKERAGSRRIPVMVLSPFGNE